MRDHGCNRVQKAGIEDRRRACKYLGNGSAEGAKYNSQRQA